MRWTDWLNRITRTHFAPQWFLPISVGNLEPEHDPPKAPQFLSSTVPRIKFKQLWLRILFRNYFWVTFKPFDIGLNSKPNYRQFWFGSYILQKVTPTLIGNIYRFCLLYCNNLSIGYISHRISLATIETIQNCYFSRIFLFQQVKHFCFTFSVQIWWFLRVSTISKLSWILK